jgi:uncharacterized protein (DUF924 family)
VQHIEDVISWWFGDWDDAIAIADGDPQVRRWWSGKPEVDAEVTERWSGLHTAAVAGELDGWSTTPRGRLALILLLDQGSRVIGRGTAAGFASDPAARALTHAALAAGDEAGLRPIERAFLYLPLMHSEDLGDHVLASSLYAGLSEDTAHSARAGYYRGVADFERKHREIVERFGRYPHRNAALGRASTPDELEFLKLPGSRF